MTKKIGNIETKLRTLNNARSEAFKCLSDSCKALYSVYWIKEVSDIHSWLCVEYAHTLTYDFKSGLRNWQKHIIRDEYNKK